VGSIELFPGECCCVIHLALLELLLELLASGLILALPLAAIPLLLLGILSIAAEKFEPGGWSLATGVGRQSKGKGL